MNNKSSGNESGKNSITLDEKTFKAAYELGYFNGYNDALEEEDYNEDFSEYVEFFDEEENFEEQDYDNKNYNKEKSGTKYRSLPSNYNFLLY